MYKMLMLFLLLLVVSVGCEKEFDPNDPAKSFAIAKEYYDDGNCQIGINKLGEFRSRFPYSKYAVEAELYIADCYYDLGDFDESSIAYETFVKLHPSHPKLDYAKYRVGLSYWADAPEEPNREQEFTKQAIAEWDKLIKEMPNSKYVPKAKKFRAEGTRRLAESYEFVGNFYCKQKIYHACVSKFMDLLESYPQFEDLSFNALVKSAKAMTKLAEAKKKNPSLDDNLFYKTLTYEQMLEKADKFLASAKKIGNEKN